MRYQGISFPFFAALAVVVVLLNSSNSGGNLTGACNSCHGSNTSANGSVILTGLPNSGAVTLNTTYSMQVCVVDPSKLAAGFRVETDIGTLTPTDASTQTNVANDRITHTFPRPFGSPGNPACWDFNWTSPNLGAAEPSFVLRANAVNANSSASGDNGGYIESSQGLPVEFASFTLNINRGDVDIYWSTATEINNDRFIIQRSTDNVRFTNITSIEGNDNSLDLVTYQYTDLKVPHGTLYYRILQIDHDGVKDYSTTQVIHNDVLIQKWNVYPNPINLNTTSIVNVGKVSTALQLIDFKGRVIKTYPKETYNETISLGDHLNAGIYYITDGNQTVSVSVLR